MAPVFFEMSDIYDEGGFKGVPDAMNFLVNGIFAVAGRPIYHHVYVGDECFELIPKSCGFTWLYEAALPYVEAVFYRTAPSEALSLTTPRPVKYLKIKTTSTTASSTPMYSQWAAPGFRPPC